MAYIWIKLEVYNSGIYIGSFHTNSPKTRWVHEINEQYGLGNWTEYRIGN